MLAPNGGADLPEQGIGGRGVRRGEHGVVERVLRFPAKLQLDFFLEAEVFENGKIPVVKSIGACA